MTIPDYTKSSVYHKHTKFKSYSDLNPEDFTYTFYNPLERDYMQIIEKAKKDNMFNSKYKLIVEQLKEYCNLFSPFKNEDISYSELSNHPSFPKTNWQKILFWTYFRNYFTL